MCSKKHMTQIVMSFFPKSKVTAFHSRASPPPIKQIKIPKAFCASGSKTPLHFHFAQRLYWDLFSQCIYKNINVYIPK